MSTEQKLENALEMITRAQMRGDVGLIAAGYAAYHELLAHQAGETQ